MTARHTRWTTDPAVWTGEFQGARLGSDVSIIFTRIDGPGGGAKLHCHPYSETFIVRRGVIVFSDGVTSFEASAGDIVVVPPGAPHRFSSKDGDAEMVDIHASPRFVTEWLDDPASQ